jgi:hypothetical protein
VTAICTHGWMERLHHQSKGKKGTVGCISMQLTAVYSFLLRWLKVSICPDILHKSFQSIFFLFYGVTCLIQSEMKLPD